MAKKNKSVDFEKMIQGIEGYDQALLQNEIEAILKRLSKKNELLINTNTRKEITNRFKKSNLVKRWPFLGHDTIIHALWNSTGTEYFENGTAKFQKSKTFQIEELNFGVKSFLDSVQFTVNYFQKLDSIFRSHLEISNPIDISSAIKSIVKEIAQYTDTEDAWYHDIIEVLNWYYDFLPDGKNLDRSEIKAMVQRTFSSWVYPEPEYVDEFCDKLAVKLCSEFG